MGSMVFTLLVTGLSTSTIITMSSHHWLLAWLGLELNTLCMLPLIFKKRHPRATEATTKYFLVQATAAAIILLASTLNAWQTGQWNITNTNSNMPIALLYTSLALKLGLAPAHLWYIEILQGTTTSTALIITTWQKIAPLTLIYMLHSHMHTNILLCLGLLSTLTGAWTGLNQTQVRKVLAASSIAHVGWIVTALALQQTLATVTLIIYITMTTSIFMTFIFSSTKTLQDMGTAWSTTPPLLASALMTLMSLGGLPPLTGFLPKWLILKELTTSGFTPLSTALALSSLPAIYFYIRMAYITMLTTPPNTTNTEQKWRFKSPNHMIAPLSLMLSMIMLPLTPLLYMTV
uniref:NADH-ubiquinone oxidoreductase chain 2 n=1 Tax=Paroedura bastardi TaxID=460137 RepID=A7XQG0_9SAUR|nr:NADH dehydrogenase subunit 2 [Paroedura bastardi]